MSHAHLCTCTGHQDIFHLGRSLDEALFLEEFDADASPNGFKTFSDIATVQELFVAGCRPRATSTLLIIATPAGLIDQGAVSRHGVPSHAITMTSFPQRPPRAGFNGWKDRYWERSTAAQHGMGLTRTWSPALCLEREFFWAVHCALYGTPEVHA